MRNTPPLRELHEAVGTALESEGFRRERRRFHPHITLMRFKKPLRRGLASRWLQRHLDFHAQPARIESFTLFESRLQPGGAVYSRARRLRACVAVLPHPRPFPVSTEKGAFTKTITTFTTLLHNTLTFVMLSHRAPPPWLAGEGAGGGVEPVASDFHNVFCSE